MALTLSFRRELTDEDLAALQTQTDALEAPIISVQAGHHHHRDGLSAESGIGNAPPLAHYRISLI
jgi:hypothetical protein